jgi:hypothetical protein
MKYGNMTDDEKFKCAVTRVIDATGALMLLGLQIKDAEKEIAMSAAIAALRGKTPAATVPLQHLLDLMPLLQVLTYIFEEAPELCEYVEDGRDVMDSLAKSPFRPDAETRKVLARMFKQIAGVEA